MMNRAAFFPAIADRSPGTQLWSQESPLDTELSCMLWLSVGVNQMKFTPALSCAMTVFESPEIRFAHRAEFPVIVVYDRKGKWSSPRFGLMLHPEPDASAMAFHVFPPFSMTSTIVG